MELINKVAVIAEIESLRRTTFTNFDGGVNATVQTLLEVVNTLEVKEVDSNDAFIEKACSGIEKLLSGYIIRNFHFGDSYDIDRLIEDFQNYMKGE